MPRLVLPSLVFPALLALLPLGPGSAASPARTAAANPDLTGYRTVDRAKKTKVRATAQVHPPGYLGVSVEAKGAAVVVTAVAPDSPADKVGLRPGDVLRQAGGKPVR